MYSPIEPELGTAQPQLVFVPFCSTNFSFSKFWFLCTTFPYFLHLSETTFLCTCITPGAFNKNKPKVQSPVPPLMQEGRAKQKSVWAEIVQLKWLIRLRCCSMSWYGPTQMLTFLQHPPYPQPTPTSTARQTPFQVIWFLWRTKC